MSYVSIRQSGIDWNCKWATYFLQRISSLTTHACGTLVEATARATEICRNRMHAPCTTQSPISFGHVWALWMDSREMPQGLTSAPLCSIQLNSIRNWWYSLPLQTCSCRYSVRPNLASRCLCRAVLMNYLILYTADYRAYTCEGGFLWPGQHLCHEEAGRTPAPTAPRPPALNVLLTLNGACKNSLI